MKIKKSITIFISFLFLMGMLVFSQDLVEVAKKERERRAKLKGKKTEVVTNQNLYKYRGKEAIKSRGGASIPKLPQSPPPSPIQESPRSRVSSEIDKQEMFWKEKKAEYEERVKKATEYVELLTLKMNGLWQEFYSMDDMTSRDKIQREISETYQQLLKAKEEEKKAKKELEEFINKARKQGALPGWLRER